MAEEASILLEDVTISGNLSGDEDLLLAGRVEGQIKLSKNLTVEETGVVLQGVEVEDLLVQGRVEGTILAAGSVTLAATGTILGDVSTPRLIVEEGARLEGRVSMDVELPE